MLSKFTTVSLAVKIAAGGYYGPAKPLNDDCGNFNGETGCPSGDQTRYPDEYKQRAFQTYLKDGPDADKYREEFEGLGRVMCFNKVSYSSDRQSASVEAKCRQHDSVNELQYNFNNEGFQSSSTYQADSSFEDDLSVQVKAIDGDGKEFTITLEPTNFVWQAPEVNQPENYKNGQKGAIVELFGWPYEDIKQECEFLAQAGYMGVKVFPPNESLFSNEWPQDGELNPWYFIY